MSRSGRPFVLYFDSTGRRRSRFLKMPSLEALQPHLTSPASQYLFAVAYARGFTNGRTLGLEQRDRLLVGLLDYLTMRELKEESGLGEARIRRILKDRAGLAAADVRELEPTAKEITYLRMGYGRPGRPPGRAHGRRGYTAPGPRPDRRRRR